MIITVWGNPRECLSAKIPGRLRPWLSGAAELNAYRYGPGEMEAWLKVIARYRRVFLYGYTTVLTDLAKFIIETNKTVSNVAGVITTAEKLYLPQREVIISAFGCKVYDQYGSRETPGVAAECGHGHMHLFTHATYAEFLPLADISLDGDASTPMRIVLSDLNNYAMPLLRYEIGDLGAPVDASCPCGRGFPLMRMGVGRIGATLLLPSGGRLYSTMFVRQMYHTPGVSAFQFRQTALRQVKLYIVRGKEYGAESERKLMELRERFPLNVCPGAELSIHYVEELPRTQGGKHRQVVCEIA
jgi:phenylacetate-CoA ligase